MRVLVVGAGGHGQVVADCLLRMAEAGASISPIGFVDDNPTLVGNIYLQLPVLGTVAAIATIPHDGLILGIGQNRTRRNLYATLSAEGQRFVAAIHPRAIIAPDVTIGIGTLICAGAIVNTGSHIGENVIINTGATVDHGNRIGDHAHVAPGVHLGGDVTIREGALVGIGATVMAQQEVGKWSVVGAAALVHTTVRDGATVVGIPAREQMSSIKFSHQHGDHVRTLPVSL